MLHDLRMLFATHRGRLPSDTRTLSGLLAQRVTNATLERLNHAGFIEFYSRETLDQALEKLYSRTRVREREEPKAVTSTETTRANGTNERPEELEHIETAIAASLATAAQEVDW